MSNNQLAGKWTDSQSEDFAELMPPIPERWNAGQEAAGVPHERDR